MVALAFGRVGVWIGVTVSFEKVTFNDYEECYNKAL